MKNLINKDIFIYLKLQSTSRYTVLDVISLSFSVRCRCPSITAAVTLSNGERRETQHRAGHGKNTGNGGSNATRKISAVRREANEVCAVTGYYAAYSGNSSPMFRDNLSGPPSRVKKSMKKYSFWIF